MNRAIPIALLGLVVLGAGVSMQDTRQDTVQQCVNISYEPGSDCEEWEDHTIERDNVAKEPTVGLGFFLLTVSGVVALEEWSGFE